MLLYFLLELDYTLIAGYSKNIKLTTTKGRYCYEESNKMLFDCFNHISVNVPWLVAFGLLFNNGRL